MAVDVARRNPRLLGYRVKVDLLRPHREYDMDDDDDKSGSRPPTVMPADLSALSIAELEDAIRRLEAEIARARAAIAAKRNVRGGADALFRFNSKDE